MSKNDGGAVSLTIEAGDRFMGCALGGASGWLTCDKITSVFNGPWWATGLDENGNRGGGYVHDLTFIWKAGEDVPRDALTGNPIVKFRHPADALLTARDAQ